MTTRPLLGALAVVGALSAAWPALGQDDTTTSEAGNAPPALDPDAPPPAPAPLPSSSTPGAVGPDRPGSLSLGAAASGRVGIMVLDLKAQGAVSPEVATTLSSLVAARLASLEVFEVTSEDDVRQLVDFDSLRDTLTSCADDDAACLHSFDQAFGVPYLVAGLVDEVAGGTVVSLVLVDLGSARVVSRRASKPVTPAELVAELHRVVDEVMLPLREARRGRLLVQVTEEGATLKANGRIIGVSPLGVAEVASGPVRLEVEKEGFVQSRRDLAVAPDEQVEVQVILVPSADYVAQYRRKAWLFRIGALVSGGLAISTVSAGSALWLTNQFLTQQIAQQSDQSLSVFEPLKVNAGQFFMLWTLRLLAYGLLAATLPAAATAVFLFFIGEPPGRYDHLLAEDE